MTEEQENKNIEEQVAEAKPATTEAAPTSDVAVKEGAQAASSSDTQVTRKKTKRPPRRRQRQVRDSEYIEKVVAVNRVSKVVQGGKNFSFAALVVVGDGKGKVGFSIGKAREVQDAIQKGLSHAKNRFVNIPLDGTTIPHETLVRFGAAKVFLKPASEGTGIIAGAAVRAVCECAGIKDILTKSLGSQTKLNVIQATFKALQEMLSK